MFNNFIDFIFWGSYNDRQLKQAYHILDKIKLSEEKMLDLSDEELKNQTNIFKKKYQEGVSLDDILPDAFAVVREACKRLVGTKYNVMGEEVTWDMIPYDVQFIGGIILHQGKIAEMKTGEGKTLVGLAPTYLNALSWKGVHVVTVNNYLTQRDCEWMRMVYEWLGLTVGCITKTTPIEQRTEEYLKDITYVENTELGFDYLRDNLIKKVEERTLLTRPLNFAIIDEVDSILIDEARTPLIISQPVEWGVEKYEFYNNIIKNLVPCKEEKKVSKGRLASLLKCEDNKEQVDTGDYYIDVKWKTVSLTETWIEKIEKMLGVNNIYQDLWYQELSYVENALKANGAYVKDRDYIVHNNEILIVDEHTGRTMSWRRFGEWLHQAIEAKEGVEVQKESNTIATITYQNFFKQYNKLAWMTGTAVTEAEEFANFYELEVVVIPTHKPILRVDLNDKLYLNQTAKWKYVKEFIKMYHEIWVPILLGTADIDTSEYVSKMLEKENIVHSVLNAKLHEQESKIIVNAGKLNSIIVATNMAGRGTDIKLEKWLNIHLAENYLDFILKKLKDNRPVKVNVYSEVELKLLQDVLNELSEKEYHIETKIINPKKKNNNNDTKNSDKVFATITINRIDKLFEKDNIFEFDAYFWLLVVGTEKHESRRIDNQLRGRSWRQGDTGASVFFVALDDNLMKKVGMNKITSILWAFWLLGKMADMELTEKRFTHTILRSQKEIEGYFYWIRKHLFDYDNVINKQREKIYNIRNSILEAKTDKEKLEDYITERIKIFQEKIKESIDLTISLSQTEWMNRTDLLEKISRTYYIHFSASELEKLLESDINVLAEEIKNKVLSHYLMAFKAIDNEELYVLFSEIHLFYLDRWWIEHIDTMQRLKDQVAFAGFAQQDPLLMYKKESFEKFQDFYNMLETEIALYLLKVDYDRAINMIWAKKMWFNLTNEEFDLLQYELKNNPNSFETNKVKDENGNEFTAVSIRPKDIERIREKLKELKEKREEEQKDLFVEDLKNKIDKGEIKVSSKKDKIKEEEIKKEVEKEEEKPIIEETEIIEV